MKGEKKRAFITGITGQDGSYLSELLLGKGYEVHGLVRRSSTFNRSRIEENDETSGKAMLHYGDVTDGSNMRRLIEMNRPHEVYNLAAQSHVGISFVMPEYTTDVVAMGPLRILEALRESGIRARFYQASSSEMYWKFLESHQIEKTPFYQRSPYAIAKVF